VINEPTRRIAAFLTLALLANGPVLAQFAGPSVGGQSSSVAQAQAARTGSYVSMTGSIVAHLREQYFQFRDDTGEIRVEIEDRVWQGREVTPTHRVQLLGEVDRTGSGVPYVWVKSLDIVGQP
jgi:uncharacterized protein (TIGR00156 family)